MELARRDDLDLAKFAHDARIHRDQNLLVEAVVANVMLLVVRNFSHENLYRNIDWLKLVRKLDTTRTYLVSNANPVSIRFVALEKFAKLPRPPLDLLSWHPFHFGRWCPRSRVKLIDEEGREPVLSAEDHRLFEVVLGLGWEPSDDVSGDRDPWNLFSKRGLDILYIRAAAPITVVS